MKTQLLLVNLLFSFTLCFGMDHFIDLSITADPSHIQKKSHLDIYSQHVIYGTKASVVVCPSAFIFTDGSIDYSLAAGFRHPCLEGLFGHHFFWDCNHRKQLHVDQLGYSVDYLSTYFDMRFNYYHPLARKNKLYNIYYDPQAVNLDKNLLKTIYSPHKWMEIECAFKNSNFHVAFGPRYDFDSKQWGAQGKLIIPFDFYCVGFGISYDDKEKWNGCISLGFKLYGNPRTVLAHTPIIHRARVKYDRKEQWLIPFPFPFPHSMGHSRYVGAERSL